ncbi:terminase large subunit domain-containing protein [Natronorubrum sp. FCH18a]|uniref:terminase large subunit domain-containing protein n=1 Tax=Natronorubrum sp. FCH18a TaxID=3447018 RepID=UPI003F50E8B7
MSATVKLDWSPHPGQVDVLESDSRFRIVGCGRRWGKTEMCANEALRRLGKPDTLVWWVSPTYDIADLGFNAVEDVVPAPLMDGEPKKTKPKEISLTNGSLISFRSTDREDSLRGEGVDFLIIDEAAMVPDRAWQKELRPTLSDTLGDMIAISTPKGRNWFFEWFERGNSSDDHDVESWQSPTYQNPYVPDEEVDAAQRELPQHVFEQEYLAEFKEESGGVFSDLGDRVFTLEGDVDDLEGTPPYAHGWDLARHQDFLVGIVLDAEGRVVHFERTQNESWPQIQNRIEKTAAEYEGIVAIDASRDNKIVGDLHDAGLAIEPVKFSPKRKRELIEDLITRVEGGELTAPEIPQLRHEMSVFEYDVTPSGTVRYDAPEGFHDDTVDALALASSQLERIGAVMRRQQKRDEDDNSESAVTHL